MDIQKIGQRRLKRPQEGDIFVYSFDGNEYYFGRVIKTDVIGGGFPGAILIYAYNIKARSIDIIPSLDKNNLIIPPITINRMPWTRGYFLNIGNMKLSKNDSFDKHIFKAGGFDLQIEGGIDEYGNFLDNVEPNCGYGGLNSYLSFSEKVSMALDAKSITT